MTRHIIFRPATVDDVDKLLNLYGHLSSDNERCPREIAERNIVDLNNIKGSTIFIGELDDALVTTCTLIIIPNLTRGGAPYALIENVVTHPEYRKNGYGKAILEEACNHAWRYNCYKVMLSTGSQRPSTLAFYESAGFEQSRTGFQKRRIPARVEISS